MKRLIVITVMMCFLGGFTAFANVSHEGMNVGKKVEKMKTQLLLTPDQESQVKTILNDYKDKMKDLKQEKKDRISAVLTPEQRDKHEAMMKEWKDKKMKKGDENDED
ncbi:MAG: hypothetical protein HY592_05805 [Candidatus Omnitrophica bacterium]|nr:hypothetical protein [Candidatus Omnitrophota bacterium]